MSSSQQQNLDKGTSINPSSQPHRPLSFDHISEYFSLSLSDAASKLGVCTSVLKKICRDNGLDWWPYRKFLSGKSIEDIKRYAARERYKVIARARQSKIGGRSENTQIQGVMSQNLQQQQGSKKPEIGRPQNLPCPNMMKGVLTLDEFKYGFPSDGLSTASNKWWGSSCPDGYEGIDREGAESDAEDDKKHQFEEAANDGSKSLSVIADNETNESMKDECKMDQIDPQGTVLLRAVRERSVEEGRKALKGGFFCGYDVNQLGKRERTLVLQIFRSSIRNEWINSS